ncbi:MAG: exodeoxyribonuclease VII small subunit [Planctomycetia bacterium]|nr:exodeoxyribonuclease VII small subunit [Planctomycetia bacterium]
MSDEFEDLSFEEAFSQLEKIVSALEEGNENLADSLDIYETAVRLLAHTRRILDGAARRIEALKQQELDLLAELEFLQEDDLRSPEDQAGRQTSKSKIDSTDATQSSLSQFPEDDQVANNNLERPPANDSNVSVNNVAETTSENKNSLKRRSKKQQPKEITDMPNLFGLDDCPF